MAFAVKNVSSNKLMVLIGQVTMPITILLMLLMETETHHAVDRSAPIAITLVILLRNVINCMAIHLAIDKGKNLHQLILKVHM